MTSPIRPAWRGWATWAALTLAALLLEEVCARWLGARDPIALASRGHWPAPATAGFALAVARAFALFGAPGWAVWLAVRTLLGRHRGP
jgi:hypothetical protein